MAMATDSTGTTTLLHTPSGSRSSITILVSHRWEAQLERVNDGPDETSSDVLLATDVTPEDYATIDAWLERIKCSMRMKEGLLFSCTTTTKCEDHTARHAIQTMFFRYTRRFGDHDYRFRLGAAQAFPRRFAFRFPDTSVYHRGAPPTHSTVYIETAGFESLAQLDQDAQDWLGCPFMQGDAQACWSSRYFAIESSPCCQTAHGRRTPRLPALYERGNGPGSAAQSTRPR